MDLSNNFSKDRYLRYLSLMLSKNTIRPKTISHGFFFFFFNRNETNQRAEFQEISRKERGIISSSISGTREAIIGSSEA